MQYSFPAPTIIEITIVILFQSSVKLIDRKRSLIRIVNRLDFRIIKVSLSQLSSFKYFSRRKRRKRKKTTYRRDSRGTATRREISHTLSSTSRPGNRQESRVSGNYSGNILPDRWMEWWLHEILEKLQELYLVYTVMREGGEDIIKRRNEEGENNTKNREDGGSKKGGREKHGSEKKKKTD